MVVLRACGAHASIGAAPPRRSKSAVADFDPAPMAEAG